jgi:hypothetical protein
MYPGDAESAWPSGLLTDPRVQHRWDEPKVAGRWFLENLHSITPSRGGDGRFPQRVDAMWDTYILFDRTAVWNTTPTGVLSWGYPIMRTKDQLARDVDFVLGGNESAGAKSQAGGVSRLNQ